MRAALAAAILGFVPGLLDVFASPKAIALRVLGLPLLVLAAARGTNALRRGGPAAWRPRTPVEWADLAAVAWMLVSIASALAGLSPRTSLLGEIGQREGVLTTLALGGLWFGARASQRDATDARRTLAVALWSAALTALFALAQFAGLDPLAWVNPYAYAGFVRPASTTGNPNLLGALMAAAVAGAAAGIARGRDPWRVGPPLALASAALATTLSRGAWIGAALGLVAATVPALADGPAAARRRAGLALVLAITPALLLVAVVLRGAVVARVAESVATGAVSTPARTEIARAALSLWRSHPLLGTGPDTFGLAFTRVQTPAFWSREWLGLPVHAHSAPLQVLATLGLAGLLVALAWIVAALLARRAVPREAAARGLLPVAVALVAAGFVNPIGLAGAVLLVVTGALATTRERLAPPPRPGAPARVLAAAVALLALAAGVRETTALAAAGRARGALEASTQRPPAEREAACTVAAGEAIRAARAWPPDDELDRLACDALLARLTWLPPASAALADSLAASAVRVARRAVAAVPARAANVQRLGNALAAVARLARAERRPEAAPALSDMRAAFDAAAALAPADALLMVDRARAELSLGLAPEAAVTAGRIVRAYPAAATGYALLGAARLMGGDLAGAREALRGALSAHWEDGSEAQRAEARRLLAMLEAAAR